MCVGWKTGIIRMENDRMPDKWLESKDITQYFSDLMIASELCECT